MKFKCEIRGLNNLQKTIDKILKEIPQKVKKSIENKNN